LHDVSKHLGQALLSLEVVQREVVLLRFQEDLSLEEIAHLTSAPLSTVKSRLYRGLEALRPVLETAGVRP
jgi:RNA polymerase sigma-70 factor, ECF subfamily